MNSTVFLDHDTTTTDDHGGAVQALRAAHDVVEDASVLDAALLEEAADLASLAERAESGAFAAMDVKYAKQRAHDIRRSKLEAVERYRRNKDQSDKRS